MPDRFAFRQVDYRDIPTFLADGEIRSKNHGSLQRCHQTSLPGLVGLRGTGAFTLPYGGVVNDYVAFYFSPLTSFTCSIHRESVEVIDPNGVKLGMSKLDERAFIVCRTDGFPAAGAPYCFSDYPLNSMAPLPTLSADIGQLETHVHWSVFDDYPLKAGIPEIGYDGVCQFFHNKFPPAKYQLRKQQRMAEFLVKDAVPLQQVTCIVVPSDGMKRTIQAHIDASGWGIPVLEKPGCFVR